MKPTASRKIDFDLHLLPPAASCQRWTGDQWCLQPGGLAECSSRVYLLHSSGMGSIK